MLHCHALHLILSMPPHRAPMPPQYATLAFLHCAHLDCIGCMYFAGWVQWKSAPKTGGSSCLIGAYLRSQACDSRVQEWVRPLLLPISYGANVGPQWGRHHAVHALLQLAARLQQCRMRVADLLLLHRATGSYKYLCSESNIPEVLTRPSMTVTRQHAVPVHYATRTPRIFDAAQNMEATRDKLAIRSAPQRAVPGLRFSLQLVRLPDGSFSRFQRFPTRPR